jgi:restriction system protein
MKAHLTDADARKIFLAQVKANAQARKCRQQAEPDKPVEEVQQVDTPEEATIASYADSRAHVLDTLQGLPPAGFERLCQRLLREAGFQEVTVTGRTGDMGIDGHGVLEVNPFVTFKVLFQCKRYRGSVGAPDVRNFRGAMEGRADKGIIITTGSFTQDARKEARRDGTRAIELVDGEKLVEMFEKLELGLKPRTVFDVDEAFFDAFRE